MCQTTAFLADQCDGKHDLENVGRLRELLKEESKGCLVYISSSQAYKPRQISRRTLPPKTMSNLDRALENIAAIFLPFESITLVKCLEIADLQMI